MFINIPELNTLYDAITSALSGQHQGIFRSKAEEVRPFAESQADNTHLERREIEEVFLQYGNESEPVHGKRLNREIPNYAKQRRQLNNDSHQIVRKTAFSTKWLLPSKTQTTSADIILPSKFNESEGDKVTIIMDSHVSSANSTNMSTNSGNVNNEKPSIISGLSKAMSSLSFGLSCLYLKFHELCGKTPEAKTPVPENFKTADSLVSSQDNREELNGINMAERSGGLFGEVPLSSIQEKFKLNSAILQQRIKKLTRQLKGLIKSEIDNNGYQEEGAKQYLSGLAQVNPIRTEICEQIFKEKFSKELKIPNNYEAEISPAITSYSSDIDKAFNKLNLSYEKLLNLYSAHDLVRGLQSNNEVDRTQRSEAFNAVVPRSSLHGIGTQLSPDPQRDHNR